MKLPSKKQWERMGRLFFHKIDAKVGPGTRIVDALTNDELRALLKEAGRESGMAEPPEISDK